MAWIDIHEEGTGKLLCRYDPQRQLLEHVRRRVKTLTDLTQYSPPLPPAPAPAPAPGAPPARP